MALATAAAITSGIGAVTGGFQAYQGYQQKKDGEIARSQYRRQNLKNAFEDIQVSTIGSDLMREENARTTASLVDASRQGGLRGVFGGIPKIQEYNTQANAEAQKYLDDQVIKRDYSIAEDETRLREIKEMRDRENLAGISSQIQSGNQDMFSGLLGVGKSAMYAGSSLQKKTAKTDF